MDTYDWVTLLGGKTSRLSQNLGCCSHAHQNHVLDECINYHNFTVTFLKKKRCLEYVLLKIPQVFKFIFAYPSETLAHDELEKPQDLSIPRTWPHLSCPHALPSTTSLIWMWLRPCEQTLLLLYLLFVIHTTRTRFSLSASLNTNLLFKNSWTIVRNRTATRLFKKKHKKKSF